jgi:hypothetical protein
MSAKYKLGLILILSFLFLLNTCNKGINTEGIKLDLTILPETLSDSLYIKMNYNYLCTEKFEGFDEGYNVFVHLWQLKNKEMLAQDDHFPEKKIAQWKKGDNIKYSREIFIPKFIDEFDIEFKGYEEIKLTVGIYNPKVKDSQIILFQKILNVQAAALSAPEVVYDKGWHQPENNLKAEDKNERTWRWTKEAAVCIIENPKKESLLEIRGGVDKSKLENQKVILKINDHLLDEFIPTTAKFFKKYIISPDLMGEADEFKLTISTNKTFVPSALNPEVKDDRQLGVQIFFFYFREHTK